MNIRYASLYLVGQIWWASPKLLSRERPCCTVADCQNWRKPKAPSTEKGCEHRDTFDLNSQRLLLRFLRRSPCQVMTGDILLRSVPDWAEIQPIMSEWERWERTSRAASSPLKSGSSPVSFLHGAASDRTHIARFCVGLTATFSWCFLQPPWRMLWLPLTKMWAGWSFPPKCSDLFEQTSKRRDWADMARELVVGILYNLFLPLLLLAGESPCSFSS